MNLEQKEMLQSLSEIKEYPLFSSMNKFRLDKKTYKEWLESIPYEVLEVYSEYEFTNKEEDGVEDIIFQDYLATVMTLHAMETDNTPISTDDILEKIGTFQCILCAFSINKKVEEECDIPDLIFDIKVGDWRTFLKGSISKNPNVKFKQR